MLKKILVLSTILLLTSGSLVAQLPYSKMLNLSKEELKEKKFKYDQDKNLYSTSKTNKTNQTINVLSAIGGTTADIRPHKEDYTISIQKGAADETASLSVLFYDDDAFHKILTWIAENNITPIETNSGKFDILKFNYEDLAVELTTELVSVKTTTRNTSAFSKTRDDSYNVYNYTIYTGISPESKWHTKQEEKKAKDKLKGKKEDINDLM